VRRAFLAEDLYAAAGKNLHRVTVDGEKVEGRLVERKGQQCDRPLDMSSEGGPPAPCPYLVTVPFQAGQRRTIDHVFASARVLYELKGASLLVPLDGRKAWRGAGSVSVQVDFEQPMNQCLASNMKGAQYDANARRLTWSCTDCAGISEFSAWWVPAEDKERHALGAEPTRDLRFPEGTDFESMSAMIRDAPLDDLVETYHALLASRRAVALAKPFDEHDTCAYGSYPVNKKTRVARNRNRPGRGPRRVEPHRPECLARDRRGIEAARDHSSKPSCQGMMD